jgi:hypothetical protein
VIQSRLIFLWLILLHKCIKLTRLCSIFDKIINSHTVTTKSEQNFYKRYRFYSIIIFLDFRLNFFAKLTFQLGTYRIWNAIVWAWYCHKHFLIVSVLVVRGKCLFLIFFISFYSKQKNCDTEPHILK